MVLAGVGEVEAEQLDRRRRGRRTSTVASSRTRSPPKVTATCLSWRRGRPARGAGRGGPRRRPSPGRRRRSSWAPSPTTISTLSAQRGRARVDRSTTVAWRVRADVDDELAARSASSPLTVRVTHDRSAQLGLGRDVDDSAPARRRRRRRADPVGRARSRRARRAGSSTGDRLDGDARRARRRSTSRPRRSSGASSCRPRSRLSGVNRQISSRPVGHRVVGHVEGAYRVQVGLPTASLQGRPARSGRSVTVDCQVSLRGRQRRGGQPTAPSICSSMSRLSSRAYSIGSSLAIGSMKPRTIIAIASSCSMPRDIR